MRTALLAALLLPFLLPLEAESAGATPIDLRIHWIEPAWLPAASGGTVEVSGLGFDSTLVASIDGATLPSSSVTLLGPTRLRLVLPPQPSARISTLQLVRTLDPVNRQTARKVGGIFYVGPTTWYVRPAPGGSDLNNGTSPATPKATLNAAIDAAMGTNDSLPNPPAQIRAAAGTYAENVRVPRGTALVGGWSTDFTQRDPDRFVSVIDGRRNNLSGVRTSGSTENFCLLDGFTITNARRTGAGGAVRSFLGAPTLTHNVMIGNVASKRGAGAYFRFGEQFDASATIAHNLIVGNRARELSGGGVLLYAYYYTNVADVHVAVTDNVIVGNRAVLHGGGVAVGNSVYYAQDRLNVSVSHNRIQFNQAENGGGLAVYPALHTNFSVRAHNNLMHQNSAADRGGAVWYGGAGGGDLLITSSTLVANSAASGGALYRAVPLRTQSQFTTLTDDILWLNTGGDLVDPEGQVVVHYTLSTDDFSLLGAGNFSLDPRFAAGPLGSHYLDAALSPALDNGSDLASARGLSERTAVPSQALDAGRLDLGVHYPVTTLTSPNTPQLLHLVPAFGSFLGGDWVLVRGSDFKPGARVTFDGADAARSLFVGTNRLLAEPPAHALVGSSTQVSVVIVNPGGQSSPQTLTYRYVDADPPEWDSTLGVISADSPSESTPAIIVRWNPALDAVSPPVRYNVHREPNVGTGSQLIIPQASNLIASGLTGTSYVDRAFVNRDVDTSFVYRVRALDSAFLANEEMNLTRVFGTVRTGTNAARPDPAVYLLGPREATSGDTVTLEVLVSNQGSATATSLTLEVSLPPDLIYVAGTTRRDGTTAVADNTSGTPFPLDVPGLAISNLAHSTSTRLTFQVRVNGTGGLLSWVGVVTSAAAEVRSDNNRYERFINTKPLPGTDVAVVKSAPLSAVTGASVAYTIRVSNNGTLTAQNVVLTDTLPASGLAYVNDSTRRDGAPVSDSPSGTRFPLDGSGLALGTFGGSDFTVIEFTATLTATSGSVVNSASVTSSTTDNMPGNNTSQATTRVMTADVAVAKSALAGVVSGRDLTYTLDVSVPSASDGRAVGVRLLDTLPSGAAYRAGSTRRDGAAVPDDASGTAFPLDGSGLALGDLTAGSSTRVQFTVQVTLASGSLSNQASVSALTGDPTTANNASQSATTVVPSGTPLAPVGNTLGWDAAGGALTWTAAPGAAVYFVHRSGAASSYADGTATRMTPFGITAATWTEPAGPAPGQAFFYRVNAGDGQAETDELHMSDLWVEKTAPASAVDGSVVTYTIAVRNLGVREAASAVLTDTLPSQATYVAGSTRRDGTAVPDDASGTPFPLDGIGLALGARPGVSLTTVTFDARLVGRNVTATNRATVSTPTPQHTTANDQDTAATAVTPPPQADLNLAMTDAPDPIVGGGANTLRYTLTLRNDGNLAADVTQVTDTLPSGVTFLSASPAPTSVSGATLQFALGTLAASDGAAGGADERTLTIDVRVNLTSGTLTNSASASTTTFEEDLSDNAAQAITTVQEPPIADLVVTKQAPAGVSPGQRFTYTVSVSNTGTGPAASTVLTDTLPSGAAYVAGTTTRDGGAVADNTSGTAFPLDGSGLGLGTLGIGASTQIRFDVTAPTTAGTLTNTASATTSSLETDTADNTSSAVTNVQPQADLAIDKTGPATAARRAFITYTLTITNAGPSAASAVVVRDTLPSGVVYSAGTTRLNGAVVPDNTSGTAFPLDDTGLNIGTLNAGATATITFEARMPNANTTVVNQASVSSATADPNAANNSDSLSTSVQ